MIIDSAYRLRKSIKKKEIRTITMNTFDEENNE